MSSIKCQQCGLVNFSFATECKRCQNPFAQDQSQPPQHQNFQMPPPPNAFLDNGVANNDYGQQPKQTCVKCGVNRNVANQNFKKVYTSPFAALGIFLGVLPYLILALLLRTTHYLSAPFCHDCWGKYKNADTYSTLFMLGSFVALLFSIVGAVAFGNLWVMLVGFIATFGLYFYGNSYIKKVSPKFKKVDSKQVIIDAPLVGEILFTK